MADPRLEQYVRNSRAAGLSDQDIALELKKNGWQESTIFEVLGDNASTTNINLHPQEAAEPIQSYSSLFSKVLSLFVSVWRVFAIVAVIVVIGTAVSLIFLNSSPAKVKDQIIQSAENLKAYQMETKISQKPVQGTETTTLIDGHYDYSNTNSIKKDYSTKTISQGFESDSQNIVLGAKQYAKIIKSSQNALENSKMNENQWYRGKDYNNLPFSFPSSVINSNLFEKQAVQMKDEKVDSIDCYHYHFDYGKENAVAYYGTTLLTAGGFQLTDDFSNNLNKTTALAKGDLYIGKKDHQLHEANLQFQLSQDKTSWSASLDIKLSNFNEHYSFQEPQNAAQLPAS